MTNKTLLATITAVTALSCGAPGASSDPGTETPAADVPAPDETPPSDPTESAPPAPTSPADLATATLRNVGRDGMTLRLDVHGHDPNKRTSAAFVRLLSESGAPVVDFDTNWDGLPDAAERRFRFDASTLGKTDFDGTITISGAFDPQIHRAVVALEDEDGGRSAQVEAKLTVQAVRTANASCDPTKVASRCPAAMSCGGSPATCREGIAPDLSKLAFFGGASPRILALALDPDEDVASMRFDLLDASGNPKSVELVDGDPSTAASSFTLQAATAADGASFLFDLAPIAGFGDKVPKIAATATDSMGRASARVVAAVGTAPARSFGQSCDYRGFDRCSTGSLCAPGLPAATNTCRATATLQSADCAAAPLLQPGKGATRAYGTAEGVSLWDPPLGCAPEGAVARPEAVVRLRLAKGASSVKITTALPETDFDSVLYVFKGCPTSSSVALGCNDDVIGFSSTVELTDVEAGDYTIVVDSVKASGGRFGVEVEAR